MQLNDLLFETKTLIRTADASPPVSKNLNAADFKTYLDQASLTTTNGASLSPDGAAKPLSLKEEYFALLPDLGGLEFGPPVAAFDEATELKRLAKIDLKVEAMEQAGEIDEALDAFIGIHGLKDRLTRSEKTELRDRFIELTKAVLLQDEWQDAYLGSLGRRIDVSIGGLREYLLGEEGKPLEVDVNQKLANSDPDLMSFTRDPKWNNFDPPDYTLIAKADQMVLEARRIRELAG